MTPTTLRECQQEIVRLRDYEPDFYELFVDAIDLTSGKVVERFWCNFRPPLRARVQDGDLLHHNATQQRQKWRYRFVITDNEATLVEQFHSFMAGNAEKGLSLVPSLSYSARWDK